MHSGGADSEEALWRDVLRGQQLNPADRSRLSEVFWFGFRYVLVGRCLGGQVVVEL